MPRQKVTVVLPIDPTSGEADPGQPALFYSTEGYFIGSRVLTSAELALLNGWRTGQLAIAPPDEGQWAQAQDWLPRTVI